MGPDPSKIAFDSVLISLSGGNNLQNQGLSAREFIDGIEAAFRDNIHNVAVHLRGALNNGPEAFKRTQFDSFLRTWTFQEVSNMIGIPKDPASLRRERRRILQGRSRGWSRERLVPECVLTLPVLDPGETRPMVRLRLGDRGPWNPRDPRNVPRTALLYAPEIVLLDPFWAVAWRRGVCRDPVSGEQAVVRKEQNLLRALTEGLPSEEWLVRSIEQYASLRQAVMAGLVHRIPIDPAPHENFLLSGISELETQEIEALTGTRDSQRLHALVEDVLIQLSILAQADGIVNPTVAAGPEENILRRYLTRVFGTSAHTVRKLSADSTTSRLISLDLPGVDYTKISDIVAIRDEDVFAGFRADVRGAVAASDAELRLEDAQVVAAEYFAARQGEAKASFGRALNESIIPKAVNFGIGAALGFHNKAWQPVLPFVAEAAAETLLKQHQRKARKAQRSLYSALTLLK